MTKAQKAEQEEYRDKLRAMLQPGDTLHTILRSVSRSGMYRTLDVYAIRDGEPMRITWWVAAATGMRYDKAREALGVSGCGTDVGFETVYNLGCSLWPEGFNCIGEGPRCPSNDHANDGYGDHPHALRYSPDRTHKAGGYALRHHWM